MDRLFVPSFGSVRDRASIRSYLNFLLASDPLLELHLLLLLWSTRILSEDSSARFCGRILRQEFFATSSRRQVFGCFGF